MFLTTMVHMQTVRPDYPVPPSIGYGTFYRDVEFASIFPDSKTFPGLIPATTPSNIVLDYNVAKAAPSFDFAGFGNRYYAGPAPPGPTVNPLSAEQPMLDCIESIWPVLTQSKTTVAPYSSLLPLPFLRSQPSFFALMVALIAERDVWLLDGTVLNRYWDERRAPRDESYTEDVRTASQTSRPAAVVWQNLRAAAESGWDFSSRWLADSKTLSRVRTLALLPPDLNSLLVRLEETLAKVYRLNGNGDMAAYYAQRAEARADAIQRLMWDPEDGVFANYLWRAEKTTRNATAATMLPMFLKVSPAEQARMIADTVSSKLLETGGLGTTLVNSGQQWDASNGWAPLQWIEVVGLSNYGFAALAQPSRRDGWRTIFSLPTGSKAGGKI
jgi:alpha,alpha-trehalase